MYAYFSICKQNMLQNDGFVQCAQCRRSSWIALDEPPTNMAAPVASHNDHDELPDVVILNDPPAISKMYKKVQLDTQLTTATIALDVSVYLETMASGPSPMSAPALSSMSAPGPSREIRECADEEMSSGSESEDTDSEDSDDQDGTTSNEDAAANCTFYSK